MREVVGELKGPTRAKATNDDPVRNRIHRPPDLTDGLAAQFRDLLFGDLLQPRLEVGGG